jgi:hypothetical protein
MKGATKPAHQATGAEGGSGGLTKRGRQMRRQIFQGIPVKDRQRVQIDRFPQKRADLLLPKA